MEKDPYSAEIDSMHTFICMKKIDSNFSSTNESCVLQEMTLSRYQGEYDMLVQNLFE